MKIELIIDDITTLSVDAIVNAANTSLLGGGGVDGAIHRAAGVELLLECQTLNGCNTGNAKITKGYNLKAKHIIHTVGPVWHQGKNNEEKLLSDCYHNSLLLATENKLHSIAFPNISTGVYHFPKQQAAVIAINTINNFFQHNNSSVERVIVVCFDRINYNIYHDILFDSNNAHIEWIVIAIVSGMVLMAEMFNTAIEVFLDAKYPNKNKAVGLVKDIAAGSVLLAAIAAAITGFIIFVPKIF